jgi:cytochrome c-type biogenesis protein CcmH/NrfG
MKSCSELLATAFQHHQAGRLSQAEQLYGQILQQQPDHVEALQLLGVMAFQNGKTDDAINKTLDKAEHQLCSVDR